jgi:hypothetical protein
MPLVLPDGLELSAAFIHMIFSRYIDAATGQAAGGYGISIFTGVQKDFEPLECGYLQ